MIKMILTGIDIVEIPRIQKCIKNPRFLFKIFSETEILNFSKKRKHVQSVASSFCAKEAFSKAVGLGIFKLCLREIEILHKNSGEPYINLLGNTKEKFKKLEISVSLSHTSSYACAIVVCTEKM